MSNRHHRTSAVFDSEGKLFTVPARPFASSGISTSTKRRVVPALICAIGLLALGALAPAVASAKQARLFAGTFGEASSTPANPYPLSGAESLAVDQLTHDVYVTDQANHRVEKFDSSGHFLFMIGKEVNQTAAEAGASREAEENVCPAIGHPADICQPGQPGSTPSAFTEPGFLAVDNSAGESKGDLYVADLGSFTNEVQTLTVTATGGTFTLSFEGETTAPIAFNAEAEGGAGSVASALKALPGIRGGGVSVGGSLGVYRIEFDVGHEGVNVPQLTCNGVALSGASPSCAVATTTQGSRISARVEKFDPSGQSITSWAEGGQLDGSTVTNPPALVAGPFRQLNGIAVDSSGNLWVSAGIGGPGPESKTFEFRAGASFIGGWSQTIGELTVDPEDNVYLQAGGAVTKFSATGEDFGTLAPSALEFAQNTNFQAGGEAVDASTGDLYLAGREGFLVTGTEHGVIKRYDSSCRPINTKETPEPGCAPVEVFGAGLISPSARAITVDSSSESIYVADGRHVTSFALETVPDVTTSKPVNPTHASATLTARVNPSGIELNPGMQGCRFEWGETSAPYQHAEVPCDKTAAQIGKGSEPVEVHADITGLQAGKTYHYRLVASNLNDVNSSIDEPSFGADVSFGPPLIESAFALDVAAVSATLQVQLDPNDLDTRVRIEYGAEAGVYTQTTATIDIGSAGTSQIATLQLSGLAPGSTYHYRAVAEDVLAEGAEAAVSSEETFTTQATGAFSLLDDRAWELVTPANKHGAKIQVSHGFAGPIQAAAGGDAITYFANAPTETEPAGYANTVQMLSARSASGWSSLDIPTPNDVEVGGTKPSEYRFFSADLSFGIVQPNGAFVPEISPEASEQTPYLRSDFSAGDPASFCTVSCYRPLVSGKPGFGNVPAGIEFGGGEDGGGVQFRGASSDGSHVVLQSYAPLVKGAPPGSLYEWSAGRLQLISLLHGAGGPSTQDVVLGDHRNTRHAISADGSRVIWSEEIPATGVTHVYLRDVASEETLQLDLKQGGSGKGPAKAVFQDASADDSVIYFTDEQQLTPGSGATSREPDLYSCQVLTGESGELECALADLTPANGTESAAVQGSVFGAGEDGSSVYFVVNGVLAHNEVNNDGHEEEAEPGDCGSGVNTEQLHQDTCNLYLAHEGKDTFIGALSGEDVADWLFGPPNQPTRVSPNGQWLAFMSARSLTGYDNRDIATSRQAAEVYLYHAAAEGEAGIVRCVSCDPTGARPRGIVYARLEYGLGGLDGDSGSWESSELVAASVPGWNAVGGNAEEGGNQPRYLSDFGRVFFDGEDGLVPQDINGTEDVYEYEPSGLGTCGEASSTFSTRSGGCISMISSGTSGQESDFFDASEDGNDVFFLTAAQLSRRDTDTAYDIYDARVGGGEPEPVKPVECQGDACAGFVEAPNDPTPDSLTFQGPGNLNPFATAPTPRAKKTAAQLKAERLAKALKGCKQDRSKRKRAKCEATARRRYGAATKSAAKRTSHDRGVRR